jgi:hypothetical protein
MKRRLWIVAGSVLVALLAVPRVSHALRVWEIARRDAALRAARAAVLAGADGLPDLSAVLETDQQGEDPDSPDNAVVRSLVMAAELGPRPADAMQRLLSEAAQERARWANAPANAGGPSPGTRSWQNIGPLAARSQFNGTYYKALDSGRPTAIVVDPSNPDGVFVATSGGGVWYAPDANGSYPSWTPITETLGSLAVGAMDVAPNGTQVTVWLGLGDAFDQKAGLVVQGTVNTGTGSVTWNTPIQLAAAAHPADNFIVRAQDVRDLKIDPIDPTHILVATNEGLFQSVDGATFNLVDLPNGPFGSTRESAWSIVYLGKDGGTGKTAWLVSGVYACPTLAGQTTGTSPPLAGGGAASCPGDVTRWNQGDIWKSVDSGVSWVSMRASGMLPGVAVAAGPGNDPGRMSLATGATSNPATTVIYAQASTAFEGATPLPVGCSTTGTTNACTNINATGWYLKSIDGGSTWTVIGTGLSFGRGGVASPTLVQNPSLLSPDSTLTAGGQGCTTVNVGHVQSWYNLTVAVDPQNPNRAIFGGDLCSIITIDGGATYRNSSNWLPQSGLGFTALGFLPYVHADWHASLAVVQANGQTMLLVGTDGGFFVTRNIWDVPSPEVGSWLQPDVGLATHLFYGIGTGDPTTGNPNVVFGGLQDNGTRWRLVSDEAFIAEFNPGNWDQILGGDGLGAAAVTDTSGQNAIYWISVNGSRRFCRPRSWDCSQATRIENGVESANWRNPGTVGADPFLIRYDTLGDDSSAVASASNTQANLWTVNPTSLLASVRNVVPNNSVVVDGSVRTIRGMGLRVSPYSYTIDGVANSRIYGGVTTSGTTAAGSFLVYDKPGVGATVVNAVHGVNIPNVTGIGTGTIWIGNGSDFAAPQNPASLGGTDVKKTWLASSNSVLSNPVNCANPASATCDPAVFIPPAVGHLFKTIDGGNTWTPFHGNGTGFDLPNAPIYVLRYDPTDTTDKTLWVGTEFGLYRTTDGGNTWAPYGLGLPTVRVTDIRISRNGSLVRISTYGRGIWEIYPNSEPPAAAGTGDFDRNQVIDFFDVASLAARMGSTPTTTNNLVYDSLTDLNGSGSLDEADLGLLLAKFGSTP